MKSQKFSGSSAQRNQEDTNDELETKGIESVDLPLFNRLPVCCSSVVYSLIRSRCRTESERTCSSGTPTRSRPRPAHRSSAPRKRCRRSSPTSRQKGDGI